MNSKRKAGFEVLVVGLAALLAASVVLRATQHGLRFTPDSRAYLDAARSFAATFGLWLHDGCGKTIWMNHFPPLFPVILGLGVKAGIDAFVFARVLNACCAAISAGMLAWLAARTSGSPLAGLLAGVALALLPDSIAVHAWFLSEPLCLALTTAGFSALFIAVKRKSTQITVFAAVLLGLAGTARFVGLAYVPAGAVCLLLLARNRRLAGLFLVVAALPNIVVAVLNAHFAGGWSDRGLSVNQISVEHWVDGLNNVAAWFGVQAFSVRAKLILFLVGLGVGAAVAASRRFRSRELMVSGCVAFFYIGLLLTTFLFSNEGDVELEARHLLPMFCLMLAAIASVRGGWAVTGVLFVLALVHWPSLVAPPLLRAPKFNSNHPAWKQSETLRYAASTGTACYWATSPDAFYVYSGKQSFWTPSLGKDNWCAALKRGLVVRKPSTFILLKDTDYQGHKLVQPEQIEGCLTSATKIQLADGVVLLVP